ncbi:MAG: S9 family peptidase [Acidobacteriota bacterium]
MSALAQTRYKLPPADVVRILDAPPPPLMSMSPRRDAMLFIEYQPNPSLEFIARPLLRLAGIRISPSISARQRITQYTGALIRYIGSGREVRLQIPSHSSIGIPVWSYDGKSLAFTRDGEHGIELWIADASNGRTTQVRDLSVNDVLDDPFEWMSDNKTLLVRSVPRTRGEVPKAPLVPSGPTVEETYGKVSKTPTYQDLLRTPYDEQLFEYYARTQLVLVNTATLSVRPLGAEGMIAASRFSPDERYLLVTKLMRPFSYRVTYDDFSRTIEVWNAAGDSVAAIAHFPVTDQVPTQGVQTGPREVQWQPLKNATLLWTEALDDGDPMKKVPFRDRIMTLDAPFSAGPREVMKLQHRFMGFQWLPEKNRVLVTEFDRDRRWRTTSMLSLDAPDARSVLFDLSVNDAYANPGAPVMQTDMVGTTTIVQDGDWIYLSGAGASDKGDFPFLDRMNLSTKAVQRLFQSDADSYERFVTFVGSSRTSVIIRHESKTSPPNYFLLDLNTKSKTKLTDVTDPAPELTGMKKTLLRYKREDGVPLSGTLYLPPGYDGTKRLPLLIWAYPLEYSDPATAGQVRGSMNTFTYFRGTSPLFFVTQGYAVLMDATMPVVGDPETMNDTFVEQIVAAAKAAIDTLDAAGIADRNRVVAGGHSYGAFMTANLLAHSDLFAAGIARSGAYNRTLTPFGFQSERRSFWEARDVYMKVSPFTYANQIKAPLLLIHGEADNNSGTFPLQSERLFNAIKGNGGTAKLVMLPFESHGYSARESVLHVLAESFEWADTYVKNKQAK